MADPDPLAVLILDARATAGPITLRLNGQPVVIPDVHQWPPPAYDLLAAGHYAAWARAVLADEDYRTLVALDLSRREWRGLFTAWGERAGEDVGTIGRLVGTLRSYGRQLESDLVAHCDGQDLRDLFLPGGGPGRLSWRRLDALIAGLPGHSATMTAIRDSLGDERLAELSKDATPEHGQWSHEALRLAALEDVAKQILWRVTQVTAPPGTKVPFPEPVPRPGVAARRRRKLSNEAHAYLRYLREHGGAAPPGTKSLGRGRG